MANTSSSEAKEKRHCPKCGAVWEKTEPVLAQVRSAVRESFEAHRAGFTDLAPGTMAGYCGSVATGRVGNPNKTHYEMEPDIRGECGTKYDVDGFVISSFASRIPKIKGKRWGKNHKSTRLLETNMRSTLAAKPALAYMSPGSDGFSLLVHPPSEERIPLGKGGIVIIF